MHQRSALCAAMIVVLALGTTSCASNAQQSLSQKNAGPPQQTAGQRPLSPGRQRIKAAFEAGDKTRAFAETKRAAEEGDLFAQSLLGGLYYDGIGTPRDAKAAFEWWAHAGGRGDAKSQTQLGLVHIKQGNYVEARKWLEMAAAQNDAQAIRNLESLKQLQQHLDQAPSLLPGRSFADRQLIADASVGVMVKARTALKDCTRSDGKIVRSDVSLLPTKTRSKGISIVHWTEIWTVQLCGSAVPVTVDFFNAPDQKNGTTWVVQ